MLAYKKAKLTIFNAEIGKHCSGFYTLMLAQNQWDSCILHMLTPTSRNQSYGLFIETNFIKVIIRVSCSFV